MAERKYDLLVWGATGFTGKWVAKHLFDHYSDGSLKWGIAGRNPDKLNDVREFIGDHSSSTQGELADSDNSDSLDKLVANTNVIISTVGPYAYYGSKLVEACAKAGTHYVDLTGEVPWMREMIDAHHDTAVESGAKIVHSCGFDSIPSDMGTYYFQQQAKQRLGTYLKNVRFALIKAKGGISGGTIASIINIVKLAVKDKNIRRILLNPYALNPDPSIRGVDKQDQQGVVFNKELNMWTAPFLMAGINTRIVRRSNALMGFTYGEEFSYTETMATAKGIAGYTTAKAISSAVKGIVLTSLTGVGRSFLGFVLPSQGQGPKVDEQDPGFYHIQFNGDTSDGQSLVATIMGDSDPGYGSTSKMLAESGVCLALDALKVGGGFWTPASAMGDALLERLQNNAGISFSIKD